MDKRRTRGAIAAALAAAAALVWALVGSPWARPEAAPAAPATEDRGLRIWLDAGKAMGPAGDGGAAPAFRVGTESLPPSLRGTEVSGELEEDAQGRLKLTRGVRNVFDYFLSLTGEEPRERIVARLKAYIASRLRPPAAAQALQLLDTYLAYKAQLEAPSFGGADTGFEAAASRLRAMHDLRHRLFEPEVSAAFFGEDAAYDRYTLDKIALLNDPQLSPQAKAARLAELRQRQPEALRQQMAEVELVSTLDAVTDQWHADRGSAEALRQLRENLVGPEAADRLEALDRETATWSERVERYLQQRDELLRDATLADSTRQQRVASLKAQAFRPEEQLRVDTAERIRSAARP